MSVKKDIAALHPALQEILAAEVVSGNVVVEIWRGWLTANSVCVILGRPFLVTSITPSKDVVFREVGDPHYWKAEYGHRPSGHLLVCLF
jgi:hypothetical protein